MRLQRTNLRGPLALAALSMILVAGRPEAIAMPEPAQGGRLSLAGGVDWINTDRPIHLDKLRGKVVLLDFWTYCCINCHHIIPTLSKLEAKYKNQLVVVGVHTAKFDAERQTENIRKKVREYNIKHPVVNDANQVIWKHFRVESWPTLVLIDAGGNVVDKAGGEVSFEALDRAVGRLVAQAKAANRLDETPVEFFPEREKAHVGGLLFPGKVLADAAHDRLFVADTGHNRVVVLDMKGTFQAAIGGGPEGFADGSYATSRFNRPQGLCLVGETLFVADTENHAVRAVDLAAESVKTLAGNGRQADFGTRGGRGTQDSLSSPWDLALIPGSRSLAVAMAGVHQIWKVDASSGAFEVMAGDGRENIVDGPASSAEFAQPSGLAIDGNTLYVADSEGSAIRAVGLDGPEAPVATVAGTHDLPRGASLFAFGDKDARGTSARLQHCLGVAAGGGKVYVADSYNNKLKVLDVATGGVKTLAGKTKPGATDDPPLFDEPGGLSLAGDDLYVADTNNHKIRVVSVESKVVKTLALEGVKAPVVKRPPTFANASTVDVPPVQAAPVKGLSLSITLGLPKGYELNTEAPISYLVETPASPGALSDKNPATGGRIEKPTPVVDIPLPLVEDPKPGQTLALKVSVGAMVCLPNTLCTVRNVVYNVPITFAAGAPEKIAIGK